jgi:hypothetical protein
MKKGIYPCKTGFLISTKIKVNGKFKSCTIHGYHSKKEASDDYDRAIAQWKRDHSACYLPLFFEDLQKIYEDDRERNGIGLQTRVNCDKNDFSHMKVWKGMLLKDCLNEDKVINWYNNLIASCSGNIANKVIGRFRDLIRFAWQAKMIDSDTYQTLCGKARHIKEDLHPRKEKIVWTMDEEKKFLNSIEKESSDYIMFSLACYLGCRIGEFLALKVKDYDRKEKKIIFSHQIIEGTGIGKCIDTDSLKTRTSYRIKPLSAQISSLLDYYIGYGSYQAPFEKRIQAIDETLLRDLRSAVFDTTWVKAHDVNMARSSMPNGFGCLGGGKNDREFPYRVSKHLCESRQSRRRRKVDQIGSQCL